MAAAGAYLAWDGQKWTMDASWGVTDGSEAQPGQVGEYLESWANNVHFMTRLDEAAYTGSPLDQIVTLNLTPGDWDVSCEYGIEPVGGVWDATSLIFIQLGPLPYDGNNVVSNGVRSVAAWDWWTTLGPIRVNSATPVQVGLWSEIVTYKATQPISAQAWGWIWARRMR